MLGVKGLSCSYFALQDSAIIDFYPLDFEIDLNGKKYAWQGIVMMEAIFKDLYFRSLRQVSRFVCEFEEKQETV